MDNIRGKFLRQFCSFADGLKTALANGDTKFVLNFLPIAQLDKIIHNAGFSVEEYSSEYIVTI